MPQYNETFNTTRKVQKAIIKSEEFFRYCEFESASLEGGEFDGVFVFCTFKSIEWYWGLFNIAVLVDCKFDKCVFRGASFSSCRLVNCTFNNCQFLRDNLDSLCVAPGTFVYGCQFQNCVGVNGLFQKLIS
jgi:uncharacterized protein YjbI with pentapeptide repeats